MRWILDSIRGFLARPYAASVLGGLCVPAVGILLLSMIGHHAESVKVVRAASISFPEEVAARALWVVSATALTTGEAAIVLLAVTVIRRHAGVDAGRWIRRTGLFAAAAFVATLLFSTLDAAFGLRLAWGALDTLSTRVPMRPFFHVYNAAGAVPTVFLVSAVAATLCRLVPDAGSDSRSALAETAADLRILLNSIGAMLAIAVVEIFAVGNWTHTCVHSGDKPAVRAVSLVLSGGVGAFYTIFLAAVFLPAIARHRYAVADMRRAIAEGERKAQAAKPESERRDHSAPGEPDGDLMESWKNTLARLLAVLVPLATGGALPAIVEAISKMWGTE